MLAIMWRSYKNSSAQGTGTNGFISNVKDELGNTTRLSTPALILLTIATGFVILYDMSGGATAGLVVAWLWGSIPASSSASFNITYVPQFISFTVTSAPTTFLINIQGDGVIFNLDATGIAAMRNIRQQGIVTNTYVFQLANGLINGKNGTVTITNAAAAQLDVYAYSKDLGNFYMTYLIQNALANSGINLRKFAYAAFPSAAAADIWTVMNNNGITQNAQRNDLNNLLGYTQNEVTSRYNFDNIAPAAVDTITFIPAAAQNVYVMQYQAAQGVVNAAIIAKG
jgi:hypothetical protein